MTRARTSAHPHVVTRLLLRAVGWAHAFIALLFVVVALSLLVIAVRMGWHALAVGLDHQGPLALIELPRGLVKSTT